MWRGSQSEMEWKPALFWCFAACKLFLLMTNLTPGKIIWLNLIQTCYSDDFFHSQINSGCQINSVPAWQGKDKLISLRSVRGGFLSLCTWCEVRRGTALGQITCSRGRVPSARPLPLAPLPAKWGECQWKSVNALTDWRNWRPPS